MIQILLAEDSQFSVREFAKKLESWDMEFDLSVVPDGQAAIEVLSGDTPAARSSLPDVAILDLKMPRAGGIEVLSYIRDQHHLRRLPVIIMTTSESPRDIDTTAALDANEYLLKDASAQVVLNTIESVTAKPPDVTTLSDDDFSDLAEIIPEIKVGRNYRSHTC